MSTRTAKQAQVIDQEPKVKDSAAQHCCEQDTCFRVEQEPDGQEYSGWYLGPGRQASQEDEKSRGVHKFGSGGEDLKKEIIEKEEGVVRFRVKDLTAKEYG
jgi:hypothetical protein